MMSNKRNRIFGYALIASMTLSSAAEGRDLDLRLLNADNGKIKLVIINNGQSKNILFRMIPEHHFVRLQVTDEKGNRVGFEGVEYKAEISALHIVKLNSGFFIGALLDPRKFVNGGYPLKKGMTYEITAIYEVPRYYGDAFESIPIWTGTLTSNAIRFMVQ